jgi:hypothetical protein
MGRLWYEHECCASYDASYIEIYYRLYITGDGTGRRIKSLKRRFAEDSVGDADIGHTHNGIKGSVAKHREHSASWLWM